eukprot:365802-Chlamydomonas_euryale.AAC.24
MASKTSFEAHRAGRQRLLASEAQKTLLVATSVIFSMLCSTLSVSRHKHLSLGLYTSASRRPVALRWHAPFTPSRGQSAPCCSQLDPQPRSHLHSSEECKWRPTCFAKGLAAPAFSPHRHTDTPCIPLLAVNCPRTHPSVAIGVDFCQHLLRLLVGHVLAVGAQCGGEAFRCDVPARIALGRSGLSSSLQGTACVAAAIELEMFEVKRQSPELGMRCGWAGMPLL